MYETLQGYSWFTVSLLGAVLAVLLFVQGGYSLVWALGRNEAQRYVLLLAVGRKWVLPFAALAAFCGALLVAFPLFFHVVVCGACRLWWGIAVVFALQAVFYELRVRFANARVSGVFSVCLFLCSVLAPLLAGVAFGSFFSGGDFLVARDTHEFLWLNPQQGLEAVLYPWNLCLGAVFVFLSRLLGCLFFLNSLSGGELRVSVRRHLLFEAGPFLLFFLVFMWHWLTQDGFTVTEDGLVYMESCKHLNNLAAMPAVACCLPTGVALLLLGVIRPLRTVKHHGVWYVGAGTVLTVLSLLLCAGWNHTVYYPSTVNLQSSFTLANSCVPESTLRLLAYVSTPLVLASLVWVWRMCTRQPDTNKD